MATSLDAGPSLNEIIVRHELTASHLQQKCPREVRIQIAEKVVDWKMVGTYFGFGKEKLAAIDKENDTEDQRKVALFDAWSEISGKDATYFKLADVLHRRQRRDLVELLCGGLRTKMLSKTDSRSQSTSVQEPVYEPEHCVQG